MHKIYKNIKINLKKPYVLSWMALSFTMLYVYFSVFFEYNHWIMILYGLLLLPFIYGLSIIFKEEARNKLKYSVDLLDGLAAGAGVILTYVLSRELGFGPVLASSFIGLAGFILLKKYSLAIYCGSFAGMVSSYMFAFFEVLVIVAICGLLFALLKHVFKGMGGKLGTIAFISTIFSALVLQKDTLISINDLNILRLIIISLAGVIIPFFIQHKLKQSAVIASALPSFVFAIIMIYIFKEHITCTLVFFSASFIGMSSKDRLPSIVNLVIAALIHAFLFHIYYEYYHGLGGKLGLMALTTMTMTLGIQAIYKGIKDKFYLKKANNFQKRF